MSDHPLREDNMIAETQREDLEGQLATFDGVEYIYRNGEFVIAEGMGKE